MNAEEAKKILGEKRRLAREQRQKEERLQKEIEQRLAQNYLFDAINIGWSPKFESQN